MDVSQGTDRQGPSFVNPPRRMVDGSLSRVVEEPGRIEAIGSSPERSVAESLRCGSSRFVRATSCGLLGRRPPESAGTRP